MLSVSRISAGCRRASSEARRSKAVSVMRNSPDAMLIHARPSRCAFSDIASSRLSRFSSSRAASLSVPGVTTRVTLRSTGPFEVAGSPICSQIAADSPSLIKRARYCSIAWYGTPAILIGAPLEAPRCVRVISSSRAAFSASS